MNETQSSARTQRKIVPMLSLILLTVACIFISWHNYHIGGMELVRAGFVGGSKFFLNILVIIVIFSVIAGQIKATYSRNPEAVRRMVSGKSVIRAITAGIVTPGGVTMGSVLQEEWKNGGNKFAIVGFILAMSLLNWTTLLFRLPFLGEKLTGVVIAIGFVITLSGGGILIMIQHFQRP